VASAPEKPQSASSLWGFFMTITQNTINTTDKKSERDVALELKAAKRANRALVKPITKSERWAWKTFKKKSRKNCFKSRKKRMVIQSLNSMREAFHTAQK